MTPTEPGKYAYTDAIGGPPQVLQVRESGGELVAVFAGIEGDEETAEVAVADMSGTFAPAD
ncbi:MAG: hypothetical protein JWR07_1886 [Nevskia sp.]|nr:hypothetical protein [Nevskia sp.]